MCRSRNKDANKCIDNIEKKTRKTGKSKTEKNGNNPHKVYLNRPIETEDEDRIGMSTYVERLEDAVNAGAKTIAVTSDFGTGKSSLISCYEQRCKNNKDNKVKVIRVNMWGNYARVGADDNQNHIMPVELHKAFIYQVVSQIDSRKKDRNSNYISKRLSKDFGVLFIGGKKRCWVVVAIVSLLTFFIASTVVKYQELVQELYKLSDSSFRIIQIILLIASAFGFAIAIANSEIIFSSRKSEGNRTFEENILIALFKQEVISPGSKWNRLVIVVEDLDRINDKETVMHFLRELRKYYLADDLKGKICFIVCIKPEALLRDDQMTEVTNSEQTPAFEEKRKNTEESAPNNSEESAQNNRCAENLFANVQEYKKLFDYSINLQKVNIDNYDSILDGLLKEQKDWLCDLSLEPDKKTPGMEWMIRGKNSIDIREIKNRLNEALTLYESLRSRFPKDMEEKNGVITFEKCAVATYLRREFEKDFYHLEDDAIDILVSQFGMRQVEQLDAGSEPQGWNSASAEFKKEIQALIRSKKIDENYRLYFYNYPRNSKVYTISESAVFRSIVYQDPPSNVEDYKKHLEDTEDDVITHAFEKMESLGMQVPTFIFNYSKLFVLLYSKYSHLFFKFIESQHFDKSNEERICSLIEKCVQEKDGNYDRDELISNLAIVLEKKIEDKTVLLTIRKRLCQEIPDKLKLFKGLFMFDNPFITSEEVELIGEGNEILDVVNYGTIKNDVTSAAIIHEKIKKIGRWNQKIINFYIKVIDIFGIEQWKNELGDTCAKFGSIPEDIVSMYSDEIDTGNFTVAEYVDCIKRVATLEEDALLILSDNHWIGGLPKELCDLLYINNLFLVYVCNAVQLEKEIPHFDDENVFTTIYENVDWIKENDEKIFELIRDRLLTKQEFIAKYAFIFKSPYSILSKSELDKIENVEESNSLLEGRALTKEQSDYIVAYFNKKYRLPTVSYNVIDFIFKQEKSVAKNMFYSLNLSNISYARMAKYRRKALCEKAYELFQMEKYPLERVNYLCYTSVSSERIEKDLGDVLKDRELKDKYIDFVNKLNTISGTTLKNILKIDSINGFSPIVNKRLWESKEYKKYVSSKTALEKCFTIEDDKIDILWPHYIEIFNSDSYTRTCEYMADNDDFMQRVNGQKAYIDAGDSIINYAPGKQSSDLMDYVISNYDEEFQVKYFRIIKNGFAGEEAAHRFCEIAKENRYIGEDEGVYRAVSGKLLNRGLEGWLTRIFNKQNQ